MILAGFRCRECDSYPRRLLGGPQYTAALPESGRAAEIPETQGPLRVTRTLMYYSDMTRTWHHCKSSLGQPALAMKCLIKKVYCLVFNDDSVDQQLGQNTSLNMTPPCVCLGPRILTGQLHHAGLHICHCEDEGWQYTNSTNCHVFLFLL